ncbi:L-fuculose-phosphate aldolase [Melghirimyces profundicolus]|uniref:L-fuculose-phosphate aldolase n=1 Tax=Melghirimyces profundicolus TaxID=1242148 RepID=A0A2T6BXW9_9BACL|nr:class II aldolase/adducin family protein [Melghirimyces profundicolus]PTX60817.1 L-fuculose-phosphate aldolase [Melghirimyces profundicolus]
MEYQRKYSKEIESILKVGRRLYDRGLVASDGGDISIRLPGERFLITAGGVSKGFLDKTDVVVVDFEGRVVEGAGKVSPESRMHAAIYGERKDLGSVIHAHPPTATALTVAGISLMDPVLPEIVLRLGGIPTVPLGMPGTEDLVRKIRPYLTDHDALMLENRGAVTVGGDLFEAHRKMEWVEMAARVRSIARGLGEERRLTAEEVSSLIGLRSDWGLEGRHPGSRILRPIRKVK